MKCTVCGGELKSTKANLPLRVGDATIVILKGLPTLQSARCPEYLIEDSASKRIDEILATLDSGAELEVIRYVA
jgi:hypothetical protein